MLYLMMYHYNCSLDGNLLTSKGASLLFKTLKENKSSVANIYLDSNRIDDSCLNDLGEFIQSSESIERIYIGNATISMDENIITDKGIEILSESLIGNLTMKEINLKDNKGITDKSLDNLIDMATKSRLHTIYLEGTLLSYKSRNEIDSLLQIAVEKRDIPLRSKTKSAAKTS